MNEFVLKNIGFKGFHGGRGIICKKQSAIKFNSLADVYEYMMNNNLKTAYYEIQPITKFNEVKEHKHKYLCVSRTKKIIFY